jgi:hypothetical protein
MSAKSYALVRKKFAPSAEMAFAFLVDDFGFMGPERSDHIIQDLSYSKNGLRCRIYLDHTEMSILAEVELENGDVLLVATLQQLLAALNMSRRVRVSAHSLNSMKNTLNDNADFLRNVLPHLTVGSAISIMKLAGAREWYKRSNGD